jgi:putative heme-binding domain-containing protein
MRCALAIIACVSALVGQAADRRPLFDGTSLAGWDVRPGEEKWWKAADGTLVGGSLEENVPHNTFLATKESFADFELTLNIRIRGAGGFVNSGVQIRSVRVPNSHDMRGYQVDAGPGWWGKLYDESRRNKVIGEPQNQKAVDAAIKADDWNEYRIVARGPSIRTWINGVAALDFVEPEASIPSDGQIGIQVHGGGKAQVEIKDITITPLPGMPTGALQPASKASMEPLSAAEEAKHFRLAQGFTAELVLEESTDAANEYGKFVALAFDARGRLWTTTALEYPVDGNESPEAAKKLYAAGGRDKVLVLDKPWAKAPGKPRVFATGLAIPLGVLPYRNGAFVQYGPEIRFYRDSNGDGAADGFETVLMGFGVQDSHLLPHQFTRVPGNWILLAQGLFNSSAVSRPGGLSFADGAKQVPFNACKLGRFRTDGSAFEPLTSGPNNIWGLTISRTGETWLQEANDLGFPIFPYEPGVLVPTGSPDRLRPYQPMMPAPLGPPQMGGSGLSGLALADDVDGWPGPWGAGPHATPDEKMFYIANPITNAIQSIIATRTGERFTYRKGPDLLVSGDKAFRPVAVQFGPDGCLYVVDWYNKIISHNEVPRNHPDRDKLRGRIWRIRHASQSLAEPPCVATAAIDDLPSLLGAKNARIADLAWQEIVDRDARPLVPRLEAIAADPEAPVAARVGALWSLEGLESVSPPILEKLLADQSADLRHEAVRIAGTTCAEADFCRLAAPVVNDPAPRVRAALGDAFRRIPVTKPETVSLIMSLGKERLQGDPWAVYDRDFDRCMARWALEKHATLVARVLSSPAGQAMPLENRLLATLALDPPTAARKLMGLMGWLKRSPNEEEVRLLAVQAGLPEAASALETFATNPRTRGATLDALLRFRTSLPGDALQPIIAKATAALLVPGASTADRDLALKLVGGFKTKSMEPTVTTLVCDDATPIDIRKNALRCLRELGSLSAAAGQAILAATAATPTLRADAVAAWAESRDRGSCDALLAAWDDLDLTERQTAATALARHREGSAALVAAMTAEDIDPAGLPLSVVADMRAVLGEDPALEKLWNDLTANAPVVLRLSGNDIASGPMISLAGPFTVEAWVNLDPQIDNGDSLLAADDLLDMNFHGGRFRVWTKSHNDMVVAKSKTTPDTWTHYAVSRNADGVFRIYIDGEIDAESASRDQAAYPNLRIGYSTTRNAGTKGRIAEFRVWNRARTAEEIRSDFDRSFVGDDARPPSLVTFHSGTSWGMTSGDARVEPSLDAPKLVTAEELADRMEKFATFRRLADTAGDPAKGKDLFATKCLTCHQQGGQGGRIGPALDGLGITGVEAILRNVLTPNAAMEGGYRNFRVVTKDGRIVQGLLVSRDDDAIVIRQPNTADIRIAGRDAVQADFTGVSIMPGGLLESMPAQDVSDLFAHLKSLTGQP